MLKIKMCPALCIALIPVCPSRGVPAQAFELVFSPANPRGSLAMAQEGAPVVVGPSPSAALCTWRVLPGGWVGEREVGWVGRELLQWMGRWEAHEGEGASAGAVQDCRCRQAWV